MPQRHRQHMGNPMAQPNITPTTGSPTGESHYTLDNPGEERVNRHMNNAPTNSPITPGPISLLAQEFTPKRAVSYLRVSTRDQAQRGGREEGFFIPAQREANKRKARNMGAGIVKEFVERGVSGTSTRRPALQAMLRYLEEAVTNGQSIDYIIVHKLDRLARSRADDVALNQRFKDLGIRLVSTSENIDQTPGGMLLHGIMSSIAEFYSLNLSNEVKKGMSQKVRQGGCIGRALLGYRNTRQINNGQEARVVTTDPDRAELVSWAFTAYASGNYTLRSLAAELKTRGLTTVPTARLPEQPVSIKPYAPSCPTPSTSAWSATTALTTQALIHPSSTGPPSTKSKPSWPAASMANAPSATPITSNPPSTAASATAALSSPPPNLNRPPTSTTFAWAAIPKNSQTAVSALPKPAASNKLSKNCTDTSNSSPSGAMSSNKPYNTNSANKLQAPNNNWLSSPPLATNENANKLSSLRATTIT